MPSNLKRHQTEGPSRLESHHWHAASIPHLRLRPGQSRDNFSKRGVSFAEAFTVFDDPLSSTLRYDQHSDDELRYVTVGMSFQQRLLFIVYTETTSGIRLIGARLATATERQQYEEGI